MIMKDDHGVIQIFILVAVVLIIALFASDRNNIQDRYDELQDEYDSLEMQYIELKESYPETDPDYENYYDELWSYSDDIYALYDFFYETDTEYPKEITDAFDHISHFFMQHY